VALCYFVAGAVRCKEAADLPGVLRAWLLHLLGQNETHLRANRTVSRFASLGDFGRAQDLDELLPRAPALGAINSDERRLVAHFATPSAAIHEPFELATIQVQCLHPAESPA
jgi:hypothetical protein